ncbi:hypothetical protein [uncultured Lactobacillus sp.]|uniref:hypothetical protein n=1 Tax=uncultured Lactobacillus sp. TaxID=153152 RepID=UPI0026243C32|nr:hypothetical protein [uncultured Lactobacillus sp.]
MVSDYFGYNAQVYLGCLGIIVHELSHLVVALLFGHKITDFKLIILPKKDRTNKILGYVNHIWNTNSNYQNIGNLFIGVAPVIGCSLIIYGIIKTIFLKDISSWNNIGEFIISHNFNYLYQLILEFFVSFNHPNFAQVIALIIIINIVIGGFDLSEADLRSTKSAFTIIVLIVTLTIMTISLIGGNKIILAYASNFAISILIVFFIPLLIAFVVLIVIWSCKFFILK